MLSGINFTKDLVSEPGNILHPDEYAKRLSSLKKIGLKINILDEKKLKSLGMNSLLGVGQGSVRGSYLVTLEWNGAKNNSNPLAFVGKGVCFDNLSSLENKPAYSEPKETIIAPVKVAKSTINLGLNFFSV